MDEAIFQDLTPVARDQRFGTARTQGIFSSPPRDVATIDVLEPARDTYLSGHFKRLRCSHLKIAEFITGVKPRHMPGNTYIDGANKVRNLTQLPLTIVETGDKQGSDLDPNPGLIQGLDIVDNRCQSGPTDLAVEVITKGFKINIDGIKIRLEQFDRLTTHIAIGDKDIFETCSTGHGHAITCKFEKYCRFDIGITDRLATSIKGARDDISRGSRVPRHGIGTE